MGIESSQRAQKVAKGRQIWLYRFLGEEFGIKPPVG
jgi:hypothetical protein